MERCMDRYWRQGEREAEIIRLSGCRELLTNERKVSLRCEFPTKDKSTLLLAIELPNPQAIQLHCTLPRRYSLFEQMSATATRLTLRQLRIAGRQRHASTTAQAADAASSTATKSKETASNATSKASQGLTRVTSSAGPALSRAGQGVSNALGKIGGRTGKLISFAESLIPPTIYYTKVGFELSKIVFRGQKMSPPLLSRSSKLHKSASAKHTSVRHLPSAADSGNLEITSQNSGEPPKKSNKRKRQPENGSHNDIVNTARPNSDDRAIESGIKHLPGKTLGGNLDQEMLGQDDCRKILKQNRLKVTLLEVDSSAEKKHRERHKLLSGRTNADARKGKTHGHLTTQPLQSFGHLGPKYNVSRRLARNLELQGYRHPTEVQLGSLPLLLGNDRDRGLQDAGSNQLEDNSRSEVDLLTVAPTGSGKTLAFLLHLLHGLRQARRRTGSETSSQAEQRHVQALVLAPTHELVDQIVNEGKRLANGTGIKISRMRKGMSIGLDEERSKTTDDQAPTSSLVKADILVSTPMLLLQAASSSSQSTTPSFDQVRYLVLDEADVLLDPLFRVQTLGIWDSCSNASLQVSLWSATIGSSVESLARSFILDRRHRLGLDAVGRQHRILRLVVGLKDSAIPNISHQLLYAATERGKLMALRQMIHPTAATLTTERSLQPPFLVFTQTIARAVALHSELLYDIPPEAGGSSRIAVLHSDLSDTARSTIMAGFRRGEIWILITTDLLSRGIDFRGINGVVNYDIPNTSGLYVHRVGRTGRQGREGGVAVTLYTKEDIKYVKNVANVIAASEKQRNKPQDCKGKDELQPWLLNALPDVSKRVKKELKAAGVEARRTLRHADDGGKEARRMRISTKSGYDRRLEQKKKDAVARIQSRSAKESSDEDWGGIED
ncbi:MAG: hypothetical protein Q9169_001107 [Polycauliona sp. 2 TL-2023]